MEAVMLLPDVDEGKISNNRCCHRWDGLSFHEFQLDGVTTSIC
ncbi:MAG: hypothetical protein ACLVEJ_01780 [Parabacteroides sp.]